jgi:hypothetical protein
VRGPGFRFRALQVHPPAGGEAATFAQARKGPGARSVSKGGSIKTRSRDFSGCAPSHSSASAWATKTWLALSISTDWSRRAARSKDRSTSVTAAAPRDAASNPSAPVPANRSAHRAPAILGWSQLNRVSRTRSPEGLSPGASTTSSFRPRHSPPIMRTEPAGFAPPPRPRPRPRLLACLLTAPLEPRHSNPKC